MNVIGRQRLLAQQLQAGLSQPPSGQAAVDPAALHSLTFIALQSEIDSLRFGGTVQPSPGVTVTLPPARSPSLAGQLAKVAAAWEALREALPGPATKFGAEPATDPTTAALDQTAALLLALDETALLLERDTAARWLGLELARTGVMVAGLGLLAVAALAANRRLAQPLARLSAVARRLRQGDVRTPIASEVPDQLQSLATDLEVMRQRISASSEAQAALLDFSRKLLAATDERGAAEAAVSVAADLLRVEYGLLTLLDRRGRLTIRAVRGWPDEFAQAFEPPLGNQSQMGYTVQQGLPVVVDDYAAPQPFTVPAVVHEYGLQSGLSVPMVLAGEVVGGMLVHTLTRRRFDTADVQLLSLIANQTAVALDKARLLASERQRADELEALSATTADILRAAEIDRGALLRLILERAVILAGGVGGDLAIASEQGDLVIVGSYNMGRELVGTRLALGEGLLGRVAQSGQPLVVDDYAAWEGRLPQFEGASWRAMMAAPLLAGERLVGALSIVNDAAGRVFSSSNLRVLTLFAQQAALAMEQARLLEAERQRVFEAETLRQAGLIVASTLEQREAIELILQQLNDVIPYDSATVQLLRDGGLEVVGGRGWADLDSVLGVRFPIPGDNPNTIVIETREPHILYDAPAEYPVFSRPPQNHVRSWLGAPLIVHDQLIGMLAVDSAEPAHFTPRHARLATAFAGQVAIVIEHARLYQAAVRAADTQAILHQVARDISASLEPAQVYTAIHQAAGRLMVCEAFVIALLSEDGAWLEAVYMVDRGGRVPVERQPAHTGLGGHVLKSGRPLRIDDLDAASGLEARHAGYPAHARSLVAVPLRLGEQWLGMLSAQSYAPHAYSDDDLQLLEVLALTASIALSNARLFEQVQRLAITDPLTGLYNRRHFFALAEREFIRAVRYERVIAALMLDLDYFKAVNDVYGHLAGDEVLRAVAIRCTDTLRTIDLLGRYGGEEFVALLPETGWDGAREAAARLQHAIRATPVPTRAGPVQVTISVGYAVCAQGCTDLAALIEQADQALYAAKAGGRDRVEPA